MVLWVILLLLSLGCKIFGKTATAIDTENDVMYEILLDQLVHINSERVVTADQRFLLGILDVTVVPERDIAFHLFTNSNPNTSYLLKVGDIANLNVSKFDADLPTKIIIHGWMGNINTDWMKNFVRNYLSVGHYNVIGVDWSAGAAKEYFTCVSISRKVGEYLAKLLLFLESDGNLRLDHVHLLGHSLGSQVAGTTGSFLEGRVGRITGMDPARPAFEFPSLKDPEYRLDSTDAKFVDVIHTCAGTVGVRNPIGHVDFYPNGGSYRQPGCSILFSQSCSHSKAHQYMVESIVYPKGFMALRCDNWMDYQMGKCNQAQKALMGEKVSNDTRGTFYLETNAEPPFGRFLTENQNKNPSHV